MSTNINISVGDNKLLDQARLQQNASRQAQLEKEANKRLEAQATDARTKANAAQGKDANGNALYGVPSAKPDIDRRPAANRSGDPFDIGHCWLFTNVTEVLTALQRVMNVDTFALPGGASGITYQSRPFVKYIPTSTFVCGDGSEAKSTTLLISNQGLPIEDPNDFNATCTYEEVSSFTATTYVSQLKVITGSAFGWGFYYFALPVGKDKYILIQQMSAMYGYSIGTHNFWYRYNTQGGGTFEGYIPSTSSEGEQDYYGQNTNIGSCLVPSATGYASHEVKTDFVIERKAYICSNAGIREINLPQTLLEILKTAYPDPSIISGVYGTNQYRNVVYQKSYYSIPFSSNDSRFIWQSGNGLLAPTPGIAYTPDIYRTLNNIKAFTANTKTKPEEKAWRLSDLSRGGHQVFQTGYYSPPYNQLRAQLLYDGSNELYYTTWPDKDGFPDFRTYDPYWANLNLPKPKPGKLKLKMVDSRPTYETEQETKLACIYDWNDPAYCTEKLTELGFTEADLTP